mmetsp:Transcript_3257/g.9949  ORF Transcript_3257/g.9949 Transcript_3257/m.9949 type:complete len:1143 (+) Transcript_3257:278-3706(+)|eukprot:CAMPEP_0198736086 /NCGR_PEP_ID=MMETSP1475-20131203/63453_1 /TAXON_ID= ORGANISM="Unidentified sp., Strain CCMP1999" /NCGR_SAMPLE_ID=MMETSP1475 /ASSEMBLY_ACC=CAM_ASM_001111 /LENGTH=1142 /DNA_ID=CAMNT_0044499841 /DNA_START=261 /DNA_END=3689 /DNA_ORIENTATION=-
MNRYQVGQVIGDGTYGSVMLAYEIDTGDKVAIKKMKKRFFTWEECIELREVKALRKIIHPNVVQLRELFREKDILYLVFEHMSCNLYELIKGREEYFNEKLIRSWFYQVLRGLAFIHKQGFFHRDLKPENLLVGGADYGVLKIADFGLAREVASAPPYTQYISTRWYRAPEVLLRGDYNMPTDIWAVGAIMAEVFSLKPLFPGRNESDQLLKIAQVKGAPVEKDWPQGFRMMHEMGISLPVYPLQTLSNTIAHASGAAVQLISDLLNYDPMRRPTAAQAMQYPYFMEALAVPRNSVTNPVTNPVTGEILLNCANPSQINLSGTGTVPNNTREPSPTWDGAATQYNSPLKRSKWWDGSSSGLHGEESAIDRAARGRARDKLDEKPRYFDRQDVQGHARYLLDPMIDARVNQRRTSAAKRQQRRSRSIDAKLSVYGASADPRQTRPVQMQLSPEQRRASPPGQLAQNFALADSLPQRQHQSYRDLQHGDSLYGEVHGQTDVDAITGGQRKYKSAQHLDLEGFSLSLQPSHMSHGSSPVCTRENSQVQQLGRTSAQPQVSAPMMQAQQPRQPGLVQMGKARQFHNAHEQVLVQPPLLQQQNSMQQPQQAHAPFAATRGYMQVTSMSQGGVSMPTTILDGANGQPWQPNPAENAVNLKSLQDSINEMDISTETVSGAGNVHETNSAGFRGSNRNFDPSSQNFVPSVGHLEAQQVRMQDDGQQHAAAPVDNVAHLSQGIGGQPQHHVQQPFQQPPGLMPAQPPLLRHATEHYATSAMTRQHVQQHYSTSQHSQGMQQVAPHRSRATQMYSMQGGHGGTVNMSPHMSPSLSPSISPKITKAMSPSVVGSLNLGMQTGVPPHAISHGMQPVQSTNLQTPTMNFQQELSSKLGPVMSPKLAPGPQKHAQGHLQPNMQRPPPMMSQPGAHMHMPSDSVNMQQNIAHDVAAHLHMGAAASEQGSVHAMGAAAPAAASAQSNVQASRHAMIQAGLPAGGLPAGVHPGLQQNLQQSLPQQVQMHSRRSAGPQTHFCAESQDGVYGGIPPSGAHRQEAAHVHVERSQQNFDGALPRQSTDLKAVNKRGVPVANHHVYVPIDKLENNAAPQPEVHPIIKYNSLFGSGFDDVQDLGSWADEKMQDHAQNPQNIEDDD